MCAWAIIPTAAPSRPEAPEGTAKVAPVRPALAARLQRPSHRELARTFRDPCLALPAPLLSPRVAPCAWKKGRVVRCSPARPGVAVPRSAARPTRISAIKHRAQKTRGGEAPVGPGGDMARHGSPCAARPDQDSPAEPRPSIPEHSERIKARERRTQNGQLREARIYREQGRYRDGAGVEGDPPRRWGLRKRESNRKRTGGRRPRGGPPGAGRLIHPRDPIEAEQGRSPGGSRGRIGRRDRFLAIGNEPRPAGRGPRRPGAPRPLGPKAKGRPGEAVPRRPERRSAPFHRDPGNASHLPSGPGQPQRLRPEGLSRRCHARRGLRLHRAASIAISLLGAPNLTGIRAGAEPWGLPGARYSRALLASAPAFSSPRAVMAANVRAEGIGTSPERGEAERSPDDLGGCRVRAVWAP